MIDFDKIPVETAIMASCYKGVYFGRENRSCAYFGYPIIRLDNDAFHECHSDLGICHGLWIKNGWRVKIFNTETCDIVDFLTREE